VRLGKFWFKTLYLGPKGIYGIKTVLELIAVSVAINEEDNSEDNNRKPSLYYAFCDFLDKVSEIDELQLAFKKNRDTRDWEQIIPAGYSDDDAFIMDPSNSKNDLMNNFRNHELEIQNLKAFAKTTKNKMELQSVTRTTSIFRPTPKLFKKMAELNFAQPTKFFCEPDREYNSFFCNMEIRSSWMKTKDTKNVLELIKNFLLTYTRATSSEVSQVEPNMSDSDESDLTDSEDYESNYSEDEVSSNASINESVDLNRVSVFLCSFIWEHIMGSNLFGTEGLRQMNKATQFRHHDADVIFRIPAHKCPKLGGLRVGFKWD